MRVHALDQDRAVEAIDQWIAERRSAYVCVAPVHAIMECQRSARVASVYSAASLVTPDGMPLVWLGRLAGHRQIGRVYGPDLMLALCERSLENGWKHYFHGGGEGVAERLRDRLCERFPGLEVAGTYTPPFRPPTPAEDQAAAERINRSGADVVWVGLGAPKQETWMHDQLGRIEAPVMIGVGAAFDFHAGVKAQAPRWMQRAGLEWLFRLSCEPRRLAGRYLIGNTRFLIFLLLEKLGLRRRAG